MGGGNVSVNCGVAMEQKLRVLLVEDNLDYQELARIAVAKSGYDVDLQVVGSGEEVIQYTQACRENCRLPDVVYLDINLPGMTGFDVLKKLRTDPLWMYVPVVMFSSSKSPADIRKAYECGAYSYIVKLENAARMKERARIFLGYWMENLTIARSAPVE